MLSQMAQMTICMKVQREDQQELQVESPPLAVEAGGNLGLKHQEDPIGFHQDARDAEHRS